MKQTDDRRSIELAFGRVCNRLRLLFEHGSDNVLACVSGKPTIHTQMQLFFNLRHETALERRLYETVLHHAIAAEKLGPGAFRLFLEGLCDYSKPVSSKVAYHPKRSDVVRLVNEHSRNDKTAGVITAALELSGYAGKIVVEKTRSEVTSVELVRGHTFEVRPVFPFDINVLSPRVTCIDGYVESVGEVHHLLQAASEAKEPTLILARGFHDDVKTTLRVNYDRGSLRVIPIEVVFDLGGMNSLIDVSIVAGCDLVSSLKGDLISSIEYSTLPHVDQASIVKGRLMIVNRSTHHRVTAHVAHLRTRRAEERVDDVARLLDVRIRSLIPNHVVIRLPDDRDFVSNSQSIDYALRSIRSAIEHGVDDTGKPAATNAAVEYHVTQCKKSLDDLGVHVSC